MIPNYTPVVISPRYAFDILVSDIFFVSEQFWLSIDHCVFAVASFFVKAARVEMTVSIDPMPTMTVLLLCT